MLSVSEKPQTRITQQITNQNQPSLDEDRVTLQGAQVPMPNFAKGGGVVPAIVQDYQTGEVLMVAYMNEESYRRTLATGRATYFSRSRNRLWMKGEESGHIQIVREILLDCDEDAVLLKVEQVGGAACHTGYRSCFFRRVTPAGLEVVGEKVFEPEEVYRRKTPGG